MYGRTMKRRVVARRRLARWLGGLGLVSGALGLAGCGTIEPIAPYTKPTTDPTQLYMGLTLDYPAVTLSTAPSFNAQQLVATPRDALGNAMAGLPAPTFVSPDTTKVRVTADGLLTAVGSTGSTALPVVATLTAGPVTHVDTAWVRVTTLTSPPVLASFSLDPLDSASVPLVYSINSSFGPANEGQFGEFIFAFAGYYGSIEDYFAAGPHRVLAARAVDATGATIGELQTAYASLDPAVAAVAGRPSDNSYYLLARHPGQVRIVAWTASYGVVKVDTATFTVTWPSQIAAYAQPRPTGGFRPSEIKIRPYGMVFWSNQVADTADVTFDDPSVAVRPAADLCGAMDLMPLLVSVFFSAGSSCGAGNVLLIPPTARTYVQVRQFPVPGVYPYHNSRTGAAGRVIVTDAPNE